MKTKKLITCLLLAAMTVSTVACGGSKTAAVTKSSDPFGYNPMDYVVLGDYKGLTIDLDGIYDTTDTDLQEYMAQSLAEAGCFIRSEDLVVAEDSLVNVDYTGIKDGEAFSGGTAKDVLIDVKNNKTFGGSGYIKGFSSGLVGHHVGEEVDCDVTFPAEYPTADLAGQQVVFRFKINYLAKAATVADLTDDMVKDAMGIDTVDGFVSAAQSSLGSLAEYNRNRDSVMAVQNTIMNNAKISGVPAEVVSNRTTAYMDNMEQMFAANGISLDAGIANYYGMSTQQFMSRIGEQATSTLKQEMVFYAIAKQEGLSVSDEELEAFMQKRIDAGEAADKESLIKLYDQGYINGQQYLKYMCLLEKSIQFCKDNATINYN